MAYILNKEQVACETIKDDMIVLHFGSGFYYNLRGLSSKICKFLMEGGCPRHASKMIATHYGKTETDIHSDIKRFEQSLVQEGILKMVLDDGPGGPRFPAITEPEYICPTCEKFEDLADQLLLDNLDIEDTTQDAKW